MREWVNPTVVTLVAAYLSLEAQVTHELAYVAVTHFVAITILDLWSRPWAHPNVMVRACPRLMFKPLYYMPITGLSWLWCSAHQA